MDIASLLPHAIFVVFGVGVLLLVVWASMQSASLPRNILDDARFVVEKQSTVRRRHADPWDVRCGKGRVELDGLANVPTWKHVVEGAPFITGVGISMVGAATKISPVPYTDSKGRKYYGARTSYPRGTTALGDGWPEVNVFGVADERGLRILARDDVREALSAVLTAPDFVMLRFDGAGRLTVHLRRTSVPTPDEVEDGMKRVEAVAAVVVPACRAVPGGPKMRHHRGTVGADHTPVSTGLPLG